MFEETQPIDIQNKTYENARICDNTKQYNC